MRALFGVASLLVVLAIVGLVTVRQLRTAGHVAPASLQASAVGGATVQVPQMSGIGTVQEQSHQVERQVVDGITKAMSQGAASRAAEADPP